MLILGIVLACAVVLLTLTSTKDAAKQATRPNRPASSAASQTSRAKLPGKKARGSAPYSASALRKLAEIALGTVIVARYSGTSPDAALMSRVRRGQVGGVILFGENTSGGVAATATAVSRLQAAARAGGTYPLLIMTDQEGGEVKRLSALPPTRSPASMTSAARARAEGLATGLGLRRAGVNVDLAPVADVEGVSSFLGARAFGAKAAVVARRACAFALGLGEAGVIFTLKHFPGLGTAQASTDLRPVSVAAASSLLRTNYAPYKLCGAIPGGLVMISSAAYPTLDGTRVPAVMSREIFARELKLADVTLPTISDDLDGPAFTGRRSPARTALSAGLDLLLYAGSESSSAHAYTVLDEDLRNRSLDPRRVLAAAEAVKQLKMAVGKNHVPVRSFSQAMVVR